MFDTVRMYTTVDINKDIFEGLVGDYTVDLNNKIDSNTGELSFSCYIKKYKIPFISYHSSSRILTLELSIPKYLYGDNVYMVTTHHEIERFWMELTQDIDNLLSVSIPRNNWIHKRIDCCYNLNISTTGFVMEEWMNFFAEEKIPYKKNKTIHLNETTSKKTGVTFKANSKSQDKVMFYCKQDEVSKNADKYANSDDVIKRAKDILRVEVSTSNYEKKAFSNSKKLIDFLNVAFFEYIMEKYKINERLQKKSLQSDEEKTIPHQWLLQHFSTIQLETILGHISIKESLKESAKSMYKKSTWSNREHLLSQFNLKMNEYNQISRQVIFIDFNALNSSYMQAS